MKRIIQWANFKIDGALMSYPMVLDDACWILTSHAPREAEPLSFTPAYGVWLDDGIIVDAVESPAVKESRKAQARGLAAQGMSPRDIAQKIGTTMPTVNRWLNE